jgi:hypothetical protein
MRSEEFRRHDIYLLTGLRGVDTVKVCRESHEWLWRGIPWAIGGFVAGLETTLGRPLHWRNPGPPAGHKRKRR